jgi:hypothetical protein
MSDCGRLRHGSFSMMHPTSRALILELWLARPDEIRYAPATEDALGFFEKEFGPIPEDFRWFLAACGGGVVGSEWIDGIEQLAGSHRKHLGEKKPDGWRANFFLIGWDGAGQPFGIDRATGEIVVEPEGSDTEVERLSPSIEAFLLKGLID